MGIQKKTPGVYVKELSAFPNSVVEVATAIPVFIGLTEFAKRSQASLFRRPTRISSISEYRTLFGGPPKTQFKFDGGKYDPIDFKIVEDLQTGQTHARLYLYYSLAMFFANGGGPCYIMSVGAYADGLSDLKAGLIDALDILELEHEPTLVLMPDAVSLSFDDWTFVSNASLAHCAKLQSRFAILDVYQGDADEANAKVITNFHGIGTTGLDYGAAYYPWIHTAMLSDGDIDASFLESASLTLFHDGLITIANDKVLTSASISQPLQDYIKVINDGPAPPAPVSAQIAPPGSTAPPAQPQGPAAPAQVAPVTQKTSEQYRADYNRAHNALSAAMPAYKDVMIAIREAMNLMPPSGAMAGVYALTDATRGVFKAPAGVSITGAVRPAVNMTNDTQESLNVPLDGKAINAIRSFPGGGILVWGARTLDGNSQDFRYVNVRRTLIMLEQSIAIAAQAYVFEPNTASTWVSVRGTIENFLTNQWKGGALAGATQAEAFDVSVGLNVTMTGNDVLDGYMNIMVHVAIVRPAEFIVITFQQKMQTS